MHHHRQVTRGGARIRITAQGRGQNRQPAKDAGQVAGDAVLGMAVAQVMLKRPVRPAIQIRVEAQIGLGHEIGAGAAALGLAGEHVMALGEGAEQPVQIGIGLAVIAPVEPARGMDTGQIAQPARPEHEEADQMAQPLHRSGGHPVTFLMACACVYQAPRGASTGLAAGQAFRMSR
ncbi:MAG: hypothetical protein H5U19_00560 [Rhodobacteraceae bacterium]|nr:hypothetical protein [Paracoccaceae bacterium]